MSAPESVNPKRVVIIGAGVSGSLVALHLIREVRCPLEVTLIDKTPPFGRGVAYGTDCDAHLLNVPAGNMSLFPDKPDDFVSWVTARAGRSRYPAGVLRGDFLPRRLFGEYSYQVLQTARQSAAPHVKLHLVEGEAVDIEERVEGFRVTLADGQRFPADKVVLALGNLPGEYPIRKPQKFYHGRRYVHVPWKQDALEGFLPNDEVLIVGAGLTAIDVILQLKLRGHRGHIHAVSRRGLRPKVHLATAAYPDFLKDKPLPSTVLQALRLVRAEIKTAEAKGYNWRAVIDALRPYNQKFWLQWSWKERERFMRHLRPFWDNHRHRLPPRIEADIKTLEETGQLTFIGGRLESLTETPDGADVVIRVRKEGQKRVLKVGKVINCTGPRSDYSKYQHPLFVNLLARGLIDHDPLALGLHATPEGDVYRYRAAPSGGLFTLGTPLKGALWECTAVPEIRIQARTLARRIARQLCLLVEEDVTPEAP